MTEDATDRIQPPEWQKTLQTEYSRLHSRRHYRQNTAIWMTEDTADRLHLNGRGHYTEYSYLNDRGYYTDRIQLPEWQRTHYRQITATWMTEDTTQTEYSYLNDRGHSTDKLQLPEWQRILHRQKTATWMAENTSQTQYSYLNDCVLYADTVLCSASSSQGCDYLSNVKYNNNSVTTWCNVKYNNSVTPL